MIAKEWAFGIRWENIVIPGMCSSHSRHSSIGPLGRGATRLTIDTDELLHTNIHSVPAAVRQMQDNRSVC